VEKHDDYLEMRLKIEAVFEHYAEQSEYYKQANIAQRLLMEDRFYQLSSKLCDRAKSSQESHCSAISHQSAA
jgi:hypothetical protein